MDMEKDDDDESVHGDSADDCRDCAPSNVNGITLFLPVKNAYPSLLVKIPLISVKILVVPSFPR